MQCVHIKVSFFYCSLASIAFYPFLCRKIILLIVAAVSAFIGVFIGNKLMKKMTIKSLQVIVAIMLLIFALLLGSGII